MSGDIGKDAGFSVEKVDGNQAAKEPNPYDTNGPYVKSVTILTDQDLVSDKPVQWNGMGLVCKACGAHSILHYMNNCGNCGDPVVIQSSAAEAYDKNVQKKYNRS